MNIYVMRHGITCWNEKGITQGRTNNRLSLSGKKQTYCTAKKFKNIKFDVIFSSPQTRAIQSANIMNTYHNIKVIKHNSLMDIDQGIFTGKNYHNLSQKELINKKSRSSLFGMENCYSVYERTKQFLDEIKHYNYENILIVTHNINASILEILLKEKQLDLSDENCLKVFKNSEIKCFKQKK